MRLHILVEGKSERALLDGWLPRFLPGHSHQIIVHRGKGRLSSTTVKKTNLRLRQGLLDQLPHKLHAYGRALDPRTDRVLVLLDADQQDCRDLKRRLVELASRVTPCPSVLFRIAVEEVEAFYLGDRRALRAAYPHARLSRLQSYQQDSVCGTWERFMAVIGASVEDKVGWAETMGHHLSVDPADNRSPSFRHLCDALRRLAGEDVPGKRRSRSPKPRAKRAPRRTRAGSRARDV